MRHHVLTSNLRGLLVLRIVGLLLSLHDGAGVSLLRTIMRVWIGGRLLRMILRVGLHDEQ